jgi:hypothetical protein
MLMVTAANTGAVASIASARTLRFTTLMSSPFFVAARQHCWLRCGVQAGHAVH